MATKASGSTKRKQNPAPGVDPKGMVIETSRGKLEAVRERRIRPTGDERFYFASPPRILASALSVRGNESRKDNRTV